MEAFEALFTSSKTNSDDKLFSIPEPSFFGSASSVSLTVGDDGRSTNDSLLRSELPTYLHDIFQESLSDIQASLSSSTIPSSSTVRAPSSSPPILSSPPLSSSITLPVLPSNIVSSTLFSLPLPSTANLPTNCTVNRTSSLTGHITTDGSGITIDREHHSSLPQSTSSTSPITPTTTTNTISTTINIATVQVHPVPGNVPSNIQKLSVILQSIHTVYQQSLSTPSSSSSSLSISYPDLLVFPETWLMGYSCGIHTSRKLALPLPGICSSLAQETQLLQSLGYTDGINPLSIIANYAKQYSIAIAIGFVELDTTFLDIDNPPNEFMDPIASLPSPPSSSSSVILYNTFGIWDKEGKLIRIYRKTHLWDPFTTYEKLIFTPGPGTSVPSTVFHTPVDQLYSASVNKHHTFETSINLRPSSEDPYQPFILPQFPHLPIGVLICFDMEFPEPSRILSKRGTKLLLVSTAMGEKDAMASRIFARTRAAENLIGVVFSNYPSKPIAKSPDDSTSIPLHCSGSSGIIGPDGSILHMLPAYQYRTGTTNAAETPLYPAIVTSAYDTHTSTVWRTEINRSIYSEHHLNNDEYVSVIHYDPSLEAYRLYEQRNPYLRERRIDLYSKAGI